MDGIFAGEGYVPDCNKVPLYAYSISRMEWFWPSNPSTRIYKNSSRPKVDTMKHATPVILAFWSDEE